jgi:hypothetical protein
MRRSEARAPKKHRNAFFAPTLGAHIRFILIVEALLMLEMLIQGYLASKEIIEPLGSLF